MKPPRVSRRLKHYLKENVFESTHDLVPRLYDFALVLIQSNTNGKGLIINFGVIHLAPKKTLTFRVKLIIFR